MPQIGELRGVFVSAEWPLDGNEGADGDTVLELDVPEALFVEYEHVEEGKGRACRVRRFGTLSPPRTA